MKYLVLLAGCGLGDGSCIEEVVLTYVALDKYGCDYTPVAVLPSSSLSKHQEGNGLSPLIFIVPASAAVR